MPHLCSPDSDGQPLPDFVEFNSCHEPGTGEFCAGRGGRPVSKRSRPLKKAGRLRRMGRSLKRFAKDVAQTGAMTMSDVMDSISRM